MASIQKLRDYLDADKSIKEAFEKSLDNAHTYDIPEVDAIETVDDLIKFYEELLTWIPSEDAPGDAVYNKLCLFYFVLDLPPLAKYQTPIDPNSKAPWKWLSNWLIEYSLELGSFMNTPESLTPESLATFYTAEKYNPPGHTMEQDYGPYGLQKWANFNQFFARRVLPGRRPITEPDNDNIIVSPADSVFDGEFPINPDGTVDLPISSIPFNTVTSKGLQWSIDELLKESGYAEKFAEGKFAHAFLGPYDYHRIHAPVSGKVIKAQVVHGMCYLEVVAKRNEETGRGELGIVRKWRNDPVLYASYTSYADHERVEAPNTAGYQFLQSRGIVIIDNPHLGLVAVVPVGMCQISSVVLTCKENQTVAKGAELTYFQFGGSDVVLVFQKHANVSFVKKGQRLHVGEKIATAAPHSTPKPTKLP